MKTNLTKFDSISKALNMTLLSSHSVVESAYEITHMSDQQGKMNSHYGIRHTADTISKLSKIAKARWASIPHPRMGRQHSDETKKLMSERAKGRPSPRRGQTPWNKGLSQSADVKQAISIALKGKPRSDEARQSLSRGALQRTKLQCVHCGKVADASNIGRWHNSNCRTKAQDE